MAQRAAKIKSIQDSFQEDDGRFTVRFESVQWNGILNVPLRRNPLLPRVTKLFDTSALIRCSEESLKLGFH